MSCLIFCDTMDYSLPGSFDHGILQARILECIAYPFSRGSSQSRNWTRVSCIAGRFFYQLSYQGSPECWSGLPFTSSRWPSQPRDQTRVSCITGRFFTNWVFREALIAGVGCHLLLPGDLPDPGIEPESPDYKGCPRILEWVAYLYSRGSPWPRDWTWISRVSCIDKRVLYQLSHQGKPQIIKLYVIGISIMASNSKERKRKR